MLYIGAQFCGHMSIYERPYMFLQQVSATSPTANKSVCFHHLYTPTQAQKLCKVTCHL